MWIKIHSIWITEARFSDGNVSDMFQALILPVALNTWAGVITKNGEVVIEKRFKSLQGAKTSTRVAFLKKVGKDA